MEYDLIAYNDNDNEYDYEELTIGKGTLDILMQVDLVNCR